MKKKTIATALAVLVIPTMLMGCGKNEVVNNDDTSEINQSDDMLIIEDSSIEDSFVYPDDSGIWDELKDIPKLQEFGEINEVDINVDLDDSSLTQPAGTKLSYSPQTIQFDGGTMDIPADWMGIEVTEGLTIYYYSDFQGNMNIVTDSSRGLSPEEYMELSVKSVIATLNVKNNIILSESTTVNGVKVYTFEYVQETPQGDLYTYQPTVFIGDKAYILTIASFDKSIVECNKTIANEAVTTIR